MVHIEEALEVLTNWANQNEGDYVIVAPEDIQTLADDLREIVETVKELAFEAGKDSALYEIRHQLDCWHCKGIEDHGITHITEYRDNSNRQLSAPIDVPYNYCGCCGRKLNK